MQKAFGRSKCKLNKIRVKSAGIWSRPTCLPCSLLLFPKAHVKYKDERGKTSIGKKKKTGWNNAGRWRQKNHVTPRPLPLHLKRALSHTYRCIYVYTNAIRKRRTVAVPVIASCFPLRVSRSRLRKSCYQLNFVFHFMNEGKRQRLWFH